MKRLETCGMGYIGILQLSSFSPPRDLPHHILAMRAIVYMPKT